MSKVVVVKCYDAYAAVQLGLTELPLPRLRRVVVKPNLIIDKPAPVTTPVDLVEALARYYKDYEVIVAEGSGWCETWEAFKRLGYLKLADEGLAKLVDLNNDDYEVLEDPEALTLKRFKAPLTLKGAYIVSAAVLKEHSLTGVSLTLKNMLGATLGSGTAIAKKGRFHRRLDESIVDVNAYLKPSLAVIDAREACIGGELGGTVKRYGLIIFSEDQVAADAVGASILGFDPLSIRHLKLAQERGLGVADLKRIEIKALNLTD
ncbi:MAG: DUF362 domain-containing protein [Candidatus Nezhaarchaeales archaeon]